MECVAPDRRARWLSVIAVPMIGLALAGPALGFRAPQRASPPPLSRISTLVLNGTHRAGLATRVSTRLASLGITVRRLPAPELANAPAPARASVVFFDRTRTNASAAARRLRNLLGADAVVKPMSKTIARYAARAKSAQTVIVLGSTFRGLR